MKFTVPIVPKAQMRARHAVFNGHARTYKDPKQEREEHVLMTMLQPHVPSMPLDGALLLGVRAYLPMPKKSRRWTEEARAGIVRPTTKPDLDNLLKHVKDCLTMLRFWGDDKQVVGYLPHTGKYYGDQPRWEIEIVAFCPPTAASAMRENVRGALLKGARQLLPGLR